jgi:hypothetical protein
LPKVLPQLVIKPYQREQSNIIYYKAERIKFFTTFNVDNTKSDEFTDTPAVPTSLVMRKGVIKIAARVEAAVIMMESARSPSPIIVTYNSYEVK